MARVINSSTNTSEAVVPFSYTIDAIKLANHNGRTIDINGLVTDFQLTESIYRPFVAAQFSVRDSANLLEQFQLSGQEKIELSLSRTDFESNEKKQIQKTFYVTEFPIYGKMNNRLQAFVVKGISEHAFLSRFKRISRAVSGNAVELIKGILTKDLNYSADDIISSKTSPSRNITCIIPNLAPLDAISWLLRRTFDTKGAPFYCYETIDGKIHITSQSDLVSADNPSIREYIDGKFYSNDQQTSKDYQERLQRIISMASDLKLSKFIAGSRGAFGSTTKLVNLAEKTYKEEVFDYSSEFKKMAWLSTSGKPVISPSFAVGKEDKPLSDYKDARVNALAINSLDIDGYHASVVGNALAKAQSHVENMDTFVHDLSVAGDLDMHAGDALTLKLVKPLDPEIKVENDKTDGNKEFDMYMSGKHVIATVIHRFSEQYTCELRVKRDSMNKDFS